MRPDRQQPPQSTSPLLGAGAGADRRRSPRRKALWQTFYAQGITLLYNLETCALYFVSADGFAKHFSEATDIPPYVRENDLTLDHNITDLKRPWELPTLIVFFGFTATLLIANQYSMPTRVKDLLGWKHKPKQGFNNERPYIAMLLVASIWKTLVSSSSLLALAMNMNFIGYDLGMIIMTTAFLGNVFCQLSNFTEPFMKNLCCFNLPTPAIKGFAAFLAAGYTLTNVGLYGNSVNQAFWRLGWMSKPLVKPILDDQFGALDITVNILHAIFITIYAIKTFFSYYRRQDNLLTKVKAENSPWGGDSTISSTPSADSLAGVWGNHSNKKYKITDRFDMFDAIAALYKTFATYFSALIVISLLWSMEKPDASKITFMVIFALLQFPNYLTQQTFYSNDDKTLWRKKAEPGKAGVSALLSRLGLCAETVETSGGHHSDSSSDDGTASRVTFTDDDSGNDSGDDSDSSTATDAGPIMGGRGYESQ